MFEKIKNTMSAWLSPESHARKVEQNLVLMEFDLAAGMMLEKMKSWTPEDHENFRKAMTMSLKDVDLRGADLSLADLRGASATEQRNRLKKDCEIFRI